VKPASFQYHRPSTVDDALSTLSDDADATILAGGQSLIPMMNTRLATPDTLVDISHLEDLEYVEETDDGIEIGALARQADARDDPLVQEHCPLVSEALGHVGHEPIRHEGTMGGNIAHGDPSSELPAVALVLDASIVARGPDGEREIPAEEFFLGYMTTALGQDELVTAIRVPSMGDVGYAFEEVAPREGDYATAGVAATLSVSDGTCESVRLAYCALEDRPARSAAAEEAVTGEPATEETFAAAGEAARGDFDPTGDVHASPGYLKNLARELTGRALERAAQRAEA
jgi:carbon-monoxide dehydrogenase medium subunit